MAKLQDNIKNLLAAAGVKLTDEQSAVLAELPQDDVAESVQTLFDTAVNQATSELAKLSGKAANLDKFDDELSGWADLLGDDVKTIAKEKGIQKLSKIKATIAAKMEEIRKASGKGDMADVEKLRNEITKLQTEQAKIIAEKDAEITNVTAKYESKIHRSELLRKLQARKDILEAYSNDEALEALVLPGIEKYVDGKGLAIRPGQLDVVNKETQTPYMKNGKPVTVDDMYEEALNHKGWRQNAPPTPPKTTVEVAAGGTGKVSKVNALRPKTVVTNT